MNANCSIQGADQARIHTLEECAEILDVFQEFGHSEVDTARVYGGGSSEEYLRQLDWQKRGIVMDTKLSPASGKYNHTAAGIRQGLLESMKALGTENVSRKRQTYDMYVYRVAISELNVD